MNTNEVISNVYPTKYIGHKVVCGTGNFLVEGELIHVDNNVGRLVNCRLHTSGKIIKIKSLDINIEMIYLLSDQSN